MKDGQDMLFKQVRHVPEMRMSLISMGRLDDGGYSTSFGKGGRKISKGALVMAKGPKPGTLYTLNTLIGKSDLAIVTKEGNSADPWHKCLGHMSEKGLKILVGKNLLPGLKSYKIDFCEHCIYGRQRRVSFLRGGHGRKKNVLELVHSDVFGLVNIKSLGGASYFVTFIDDASRKEYSNRFGIKHEKTMPGTPQQNGVIERMNRTIMEKVRSMLPNSRLEKKFWVEAVRTACYLINRSPTTTFTGGIPKEVWTGKNLNYSHLKIFGCKPFVHIPKENRTKLDDKSIKCIFLGYANEDFGYRLWDPVKHKIIRSRDVIFNESEMFKRTEHEEQQVENDEQKEGILQEPLHEIQPNNAPPQLVHKSSRPHKPSQRYPPSNYILLIDEGEPNCFQDYKVEHNEEWKKAMEEEMNSLQENKTWELVNLPKGRKALQNKWVYRIKHEGEKRRRGIKQGWW
eukprot:PITA_23266